jgi:hypothetical protein
MVGKILGRISCYCLTGTHRSLAIGHHRAQRHELAEQNDWVAHYAVRISNALVGLDRDFDKLPTGR